MLRWQNNILSFNISKLKLYGEFLERTFKKHCQICCVGSRQYHAGESYKLNDGHGSSIARTLQTHFKFKPTNHTPKHHMTSISSVLSRPRGLLHSSLCNGRSFSTARILYAHPLNEYTYPFTDLQDLSHTTSLDNLAVLGNNITDISLSNHDGLQATEVLSPFLAKIVGVSDVLIWPKFSCYTEALLYNMHDLTGMPWWAAIFIGGMLVRLLFMMPMKILNDVNLHRIKNIMESQEVKDLTRTVVNEIRPTARRNNWTEKQAQKQLHKQMKSHLKALYRRDRCHPLLEQATIPLSLLPWMAISHADKNIVSRAKNPLIDFHSDYLSLNQGGLAWFTDLTLADTTLVLPLIVGGLHLLNIEFNQVFLSKPMKFITLVRGAAIGSIGVAGILPAAVAVFWVSSAASMTLINVLMMYSPFRRLVRMPQSSWETHTPFRTLGSGLKVKYYDKWSDNLYQNLGPKMGSRQKTDRLLKAALVLGPTHFIVFCINFNHTLF